MASKSFLPPLSQRKDLYLLGHQWIAFQRPAAVIPESVSYAMIDLYAAHMNNETAKKTLLDQDWSIDAAADNLVLLRKGKIDGIRLIDIGPASFCTTPDLFKGRQDPVIRIQQVQFPAVITPSTRMLPVTYYWKVSQKLAGNGKVTLSINNKNTMIWASTMPIACSLPLKKGDFVKETRHYTIPQLMPGTYTLSVDVQTTSPKKDAFYWSGPFTKTLEVR